MATRSPQRCSIPLLVSDWLLDDGTAQPLVWPPRVHLHLVLHLFRLVLLDGRSQILDLAPVCSVPLRISSRSQKLNNARVSAAHWTRCEVRQKTNW